MKNKIVYIISLILIIYIAIINLYYNHINNHNNTIINLNYFSYDTNITINIYDKNVDKSIINDYLYKKINNFEVLFSKTNIKSELYKINSINDTDYHSISVDNAYLFSFCKYLNKISNYKFDISIGKLTNLWTNARNNNVFPDKIEINNYLKEFNYFEYDLYEKIDGNYYIFNFENLYNDKNYIYTLDKYRQKKNFFI